MDRTLLALLALTLASTVAIQIHGEAQHSPPPDDLMTQLSSEMKEKVEEHKKKNINDIT